LQQHPNNSIRKLHSEKEKGLIGSIIIHVTLLLLLIFVAFKVPPPPEFEEGIEVSFGTYETGFGLIEPAATSASTSPATAPAPRVTSVDEPLLTQDFEEAPEVIRVDPNAERIRREQAAEAERIRQQNIEAERIRREQEAERQRIAAEQQREADIADFTRNALAGGRNTGAESSSEGIAGGTGNQGSPTGSTNSNVRDDGSRGSSVSYNLGGRGHQSLPNARYDCQADGIVIVEIRVDRDGRVTQADPGRPGSTSIVECLTRAAREAALATRFNPDPNAPAIQLGTITYNFILR